MGCGSSNNQIQSDGILSKPEVFFLLGGPGSGKGTQAEYLIRDYKFKHLSTGDLLRQEKMKGGQYADKIDNFIKEGKLLPSDLVVKLLKKSISTYGNRRYVFDGFPRNQQNWDEFQKQLQNIVVVRNLIYFDCPIQTLVDRINQRSKTSGRADDNPETIKKRLDTFEKQTIPIIKDFQKRGNCLKINAINTREKVYNQLRDALSAVNVEPPNPAFLIFVLGGPGSGKGTQNMIYIYSQCEILVKKYGFLHLSTGDLLRDQVKSGSELGKKFDASIKEGKLVSSSEMVMLVQQKIERNNYGGRYLLDGFPRGQQNMDVWEKIMSKWVNLKSVIYFECNQDELKRRILERGKTSGRSDDNEESIQKRLTVFRDQTKPVVDFYSKTGKLHKFDATRTVQAIAADVEKHLQTMGVFPKSSNLERPKAIIILGSSGSGKSTQCKKIAANFGFIHISAGDLLRDEISKKGKHAELFSECIKNGKLAPSQMVIQLVKGVVQSHKWRGVFILDGFPRNKENLTRWNEELGTEIQIDHMLLLECDQKKSLERMNNRKEERTDDNPESIKKKITTFKEQTLPIIEKYSKQPNFIHKMDANKANDQVYNQIVVVLSTQGFKEK